MGEFISRRQIEYLLKDWGDLIAQEIEGCNFSSETITSKLMNCGVIVNSGLIPVPNYWPGSSLPVINNGIWGLEVKHRNILVQWFVLGLGGTELAKEYKCSRGTIYNYRDKAIDNLISVVNS